MTGRSYGELDLVDRGRQWCLSGVPPHVVIRLKQLFPRIGRTAVQPFHFPADRMTAADLEWFIGRYPMQMSLRDRAKLRDERLAFEQEQRALEALMLPEYVPPAREGWNPGKAPRHYQAQAIELLARRKALLLADEVGLGKTIVGAGACLLPDARPAHIVVEPHVQQQWADRIAEFTDLSVHQIRRAKPYQMPPSDVYLWRYSNIAGWIDALDAAGDVGLVCYDEIQSLRGGVGGKGGTDKGRAAAVLSGKARYTLGLTATPIYNYGSEMHTVMKAVDPTVLGSRKVFLREWCDGGGVMGQEKAAALGSFLREARVFLRRTRSDVGRELPPVNVIVEPIDYDERELRSIDDLAHQLAARAVSGTWEERGQATRELDMRVRHATGVAKAAKVADYVRILLDAGEKVLLVGWHRDVYSIWLKKLAAYQPALYTGTETAAGKNRSKDAFLAGESQLLVMSLRSGAGLDGLQDVCSTVVFGELDWSPGIHHQVIGRLDRDRSDGERNRVMAVYLVTNDGSDPPMMETLGLKRADAAAINDPSLGVQRTESDHGQLRALVERYLHRRRYAA